MYVPIKIWENSICPSCNTIPVQDQCVQCFTCEVLFPAVCGNASNAIHLGSKTMVKTFTAAPTKPSFNFFCNSCLTKLEINMVMSESEKDTALEKKVGRSDDNSIDLSPTLVNRSNSNNNNNIIVTLIMIPSG